MAVRAGHGKGKGRPHVEVLPADELPEGVPAPASPVAQRDAQGRLLPGPGAAAIASKGGHARKRSLELRRLLGLVKLPEGHAFQPYTRFAEEFRNAEMAKLAAVIGGGEVSAGPASIVSSAALQLAASRMLWDAAIQSGGDIKMLTESSRLANESRQNLLAAHELVAKEAKARTAGHPGDTHRAVFETFGGPAR